MKRVLYVSPLLDQWKVHWEKERSGSVHSKKEDAIKEAKRIVASLPEGSFSQIIVQPDNDTFQTEWTYGKDPFPSKG